MRRAGLLACALVAGAVFAANVELPVRTVNGQKYFVYRVHRHDTVFGVANLLGVSREDIIRYNAKAADGLRTDMDLFFPVDKFSDKFGTSTSSATASAGTTVDYVVKRGDTLFGISRRFGVTAEQIVACNPSAETGVKAGETLHIPVAGTAASEPVGPIPGDDGNNALTPVNREKVLINNNVVSDEDATDTMPDVNETAMDTASGDKDTAAVITAPQLHEYTVAVMLPFMLGDERAAKAAASFTDFYKGLLVAVDTLRDTAPKVRIIALDTDNSADRAIQLLNQDPRLAKADLIIAPDNVEQLAAIADFGRRNGAYVLNYSNTRDTSYIDNPYVMQGLIPSQTMLRKAVRQYVAGLDDLVPVILRNTAGAHDKAGFVNDFIAACAEKGITPLEVSYEGSLSQAELEEQLGVPGEQTKYVFIPMSGTRTEFNKFSTALARYRSAAVTAGGNVRVLGYPEWSAFRNDSQKALYDLDATIYTRSFFNPGDSDVCGVENSFVRWYGTAPVDGVPNQGLLGYDTGCFVLKLLSAGILENGTQARFAGTDGAAPLDGVLYNPGGAGDWQGVQSTYRFRQVDGAVGPVNESLYIVHFRPGELIQTEVI